MDFVGLILQLFPGRAGCESSAQGEGVGWHAQVAHRYVFSFCAYQHFTHQLLFCSKAEPPWHVWDWEGKEERQGSSSRGALCQTLVSTSFEAHLCGSDFCPCCSPALSRFPWDLLSLLGILPFNLLPLITNPLSRAWLLTAKAVLAPRSCWVRRQSPLLLLDPSGYRLTRHCHTATAFVLPLLSRVGLVPAWLQGSLAQWPKTARN